MLMYPHKAASPRLVLLTSAAGSDVSVVIKHEVKFVLAEHKVMFHKLFIY